MNRLFYTILPLLWPLFTRAQEPQFFTVSATGSLSNGGYTSSLPIQFNATNDCLKLNSGLVVYAGLKGSQVFIISCRSVTTEPGIKLTLFPNPATAVSRLVSSLLLRSEQQLLISVLDAKGRVVLQFNKTADQLFAGTDIDVQPLAAGSYFMRVDGRVYHQVIPFIKTN
jgi:hypothetical protein